MEKIGNSVSACALIISILVFASLISPSSAANCDPNQTTEKICKGCPPDRTCAVTKTPPLECEFNCGVEFKVGADNAELSLKHISPEQAQHIMDYLQIGK
jgi:hypothetical protein